MWCKSQETNDHSGQAISEDDINFGVLVLRVSLLSIQNLPHSKYPTAGVLSTHLDHLEHWFVTLADELGNFQALERKPSIVTVQHRFYHVCYLQNYAKVRPSWAVLSAAVKDARELGLHMKDPGISLSDLDMELRRRTFWNLYVWDRYMCTFFGLWPLIPEGYFDIDPPHDDLQALTITPYILTPFTDRVFHIKLARYLTAFMSPPSWKDDQHAPAVVAEFAQRFQEVIIDPLPPAYWLENPDTTWDVADTAIPCKREYLHLSIHSTKASLYRAFADPCNHLHRETNTPLKHGTDLLTLSHRRALMDATCKAISSITKLYALTGDEEGGAAERLFMLPTWLVDALACLGVCLLSVQADEGKLAEKGLQINLDQGLRSSFAIFFNGFALLCQQAPQYGLAKRGMKVLESLHDILHASPSRAVRLDANDGETIPLGAFSIGQAGGTSFQLEHALVSLHSRGGEKSHGRNSTALPEWLPSFLESPGRSWLFQDGAFFGNLLA
ncbi:uncharacterized protein N7473_012025 [Penicillium subrubescens]|uniref:Xylanolytic transcriptional activator regulatory domain-containing protein n=1 Tax=Penicillium subrubescens TaxID=1316194 RepID=A0A1Q5UJJ4_9EURO|nr:uncharacterized protein N7473_012025 [Penicillium subrubescens]KAJ5880972.1 hypothetical protein N7473_012025 [Penicillium subrubescens]OKP12647.1 hypothetical protein PENSUB_1740 [Penicillium subrubescens]